MDPFISECNHPDYVPMWVSFFFFLFWSLCVLIFFNYIKFFPNVLPMMLRAWLVRGFLFLFSNMYKNNFFLKLNLKLVFRNFFLYFTCLAPSFKNNFQNTKNKKIIVWETISILRLKKKKHLQKVTYKICRFFFFFFLRIMIKK